MSVRQILIRDFAASVARGRDDAVRRALLSSMPPNSFSVVGLDEVALINDRIDSLHLLWTLGAAQALGARVLFSCSTAVSHLSPTGPETGEPPL